MSTLPREDPDVLGPSHGPLRMCQRARRVATMRQKSRFRSATALEFTGSSCSKEPVARSCPGKDLNSFTPARAKAWVGSRAPRPVEAKPTRGPTAPRQHLQLVLSPRLALRILGQSFQGSQAFHHLNKQSLRALSGLSVPSSVTNLLCSCWLPGPDAFGSSRPV